MDFILFGIKSQKIEHNEIVYKPSPSQEYTGTFFPKYQYTVESTEFKFEFKFAN